MIPYFGKLFLDYYNQKENTNYTAERFFVDVLHPIVFDCKPEEYLIWVQNTQFTIGSQLAEYRNKEFRETKLNEFITQMKTNKKTMSMLIGGGGEDTATTSGQFHDYLIPDDPEFKFYSWIGSMLAINVSHADTKTEYSILLDNAEILYQIFKGISEYRDFLTRNSNETEFWGGKQLLKWNGWWLLRYLDDNQTTVNDIVDNSVKVGKVRRLNKSIKWHTILSNLPNKFDITKINSYIYILDKLNIVVGLIPIDLSGVSKPILFYKKIIGENDYINNKEKINELFGSFYTDFPSICDRGYIGINSMKPSKYVGSFNKENIKENEIKLKTRKIWIMAMLDNTELNNISKNLVTILQEYLNDNENGKTTKLRKVESLCKSYDITQFIKILGEIIKDMKNNRMLDESKKEVINNFMDNALKLTSEQSKSFIEFLKLNFILNY